MIVTKTDIEGLLILEPAVFGDSRGYFLESWNKDLLEKKQILFSPVQQNESGSAYGVIRGLHYQLNPFAQAKLVRVVSGEVLDVAVDLRIDSPTYGKFQSVVLSSVNKKQFLIPRGFAHGFSVLSEFAVFAYMCDEYYNPSAERGISFNDKFLNIDWMIPADKQIISQKDIKNPDFANAEKNF
jgi:dTDP-4-dehydrorhamnose 3,5-epimerase